MSTDLSLTNTEISRDYHPIERYVIVNILGKRFHVKENFIPNLKEFYHDDRQEFILDISPSIFEAILQYYSTRKLYPPANIQLDYFKEILEKFHIDTSSLDVDQRYERLVPRQKALQLIHIVFEYPDSCQLAQVVHYICSMIALLSCLLVSLSLASRDWNMDVHRENRTEREYAARSKFILDHFQNRSSSFFIIDLFCLVWAIGETSLRTLSTPSLYRYLTTFGLFDIIGVLSHLIYICLDTKSSQCRENPIDTLNCIVFYQRIMIANLLRKVRLVRYIRPLKYFLQSLLDCKRELTRLIVLISFLLAFLAPLIFIIETSHISECSSSSSTQIPLTRCIRTISDACYYLILIITTVGYGDVYPMSSIAHVISMFASLLSLMIVSIVLSAIYSKYISVREVYQLQLTMPENRRYLIDDHPQDNEEQTDDDVTEQVNERLKYLGVRR